MQWYPGNKILEQWQYADDVERVSHVLVLNTLHCEGVFIPKLTG